MGHIMFLWSMGRNYLIIILQIHTWLDLSVPDKKEQ